MNVPAYPTLIPWAQAYTEFLTVRRRIAHSFNDLYLSLSESEQSELQVAVAEYPYADKIVDDGYPYWPSGTEIPDNFIASDKLPFGFILTNSCEASDYLFTADSLEQVSNGLIPAGGAIGLFEIADFLTNLPNRHDWQPQKADWQITAGATTIHIPLNLATQHNRTIIERRLGETVDFMHLKNASSAIEQLSALEIFNSIRKNWTVRVLFFSKTWFKLLRQRTDYPAANELRAHVVNRAWKAYARVRRQKSNRLRECLEDAFKGGSNQRQLAETAVSLLTSLEDVLAGRRPFFIPRRKNSHVGPFGAICHEILKYFEQESWVLAPGYLSADNEVGYMKLDHASPTILNGPAKAAKDKVIEIMSILRAAAQSAKKRHGDNQPSFDLQPYVDLLPHVVFQTPATRSQSSPAQGPSVYQFRMDKQLKPTKPHILTQQAFFDPLFDVIPRERSAFFRNSLRISKNPI
jgi:hypothetical protein